MLDVALDLAGHGRSDKERDAWTVERFADDVAAVVPAADPARAVAMLEHAFAFDLGAALRPARVPVHEILAQPERTSSGTSQERPFEAETLPGVGPWPMVQAPDVFADALLRAPSSAVRT